MTAGYSGTPLEKKLGIKDNSVMAVFHEPRPYSAICTNLPGSVVFSKRKNQLKHIIHYFAKEAKSLQEDLPFLKQQIFQDGMIWISWPKKSSGLKTDIDEDLVRKLALQNELVDIKVCAVDEIWSGLKLVIPVKLRK